jgi:hypothetical protein
MTSRDNSQIRSLLVAREMGTLYVSLTTAKFARYEREFRGLGRALNARVRHGRERTELQRRIVEEILLGAVARNTGASTVTRLIREIEGLGYSNVERRAHVSILFGQWASRHRRYGSAAIEMLQSASQRVRHLPVQSASRRHLTGAIRRNLRGLGAQ